MAKIYLSVIVPCYNEEENLKKGVLNQMATYLNKQKYPYEVIISDDGSTDRSVELAKMFAKKHSHFRVVENEHGGKPFAVKSGLERAKGKVVLFADMDQSTSISEFGKLLPFFKKGYPVVIGSRGRKREGSSLFRLMASNVFMLVRKSLVLSNIADTQCGFKAFERKVALELFNQLQVFREKEQVKGWRVSAYDVELLFIARKRGYKIAETVVKWRDEDASKGKERKFVKESKEMFKEILRVRLNDLRGLYCSPSKDRKLPRHAKRDAEIHN